MPLETPGGATSYNLDLQASRQLKWARRLPPVLRPAPHLAAEVQGLSRLVCLQTEPER